MNGWILYKDNGNLHRSEKNDITDFLKYGKKLGLKILIIDPETIDFICDYEEKSTCFFIEGKSIKNPDFVIPYQGVQNTNQTLLLLDALQNIGVFVLNTAQSIRSCKSKVEQIIILASNKIPYPKSVFIKSPADFVAKCKLIEYPALLKPVEGTQGMGIILIENETLLIDIANYVRQNVVDNIFMVQRFIEESKGKAIRLVILNGKIISSYYKISHTSYKVNAALDAQIVQFQPNKQLSAIGIATAKAFGLDLAGVDVLESKQGYLVCDVNSAPSFVATHSFQNEALAEQVLTYIKVNSNKSKIRSSDLISTEIV